MKLLVNLIVSRTSNIHYECLYFLTMCLYFQGYGIFATKEYQKGSYILEYAGEVVSAKKAEKLEVLYASKSLGNFLYFFGKHWYMISIFNNFSSPTLHCSS